MLSDSLANILLFFGSIYMLPLDFRSKHIRSETEVKIINGFIDQFKESIDKNHHPPTPIRDINHAYVFVPNLSHYFILTKYNLHSGIYFDLLIIRYPPHDDNDICKYCEHANPDTVKNLIARCNNLVIGRDGQLVKR